MDRWKWEELELNGNGPKRLDLLGPPVSGFCESSGCDSEPSVVDVVARTEHVFDRAQGASELDWCRRLVGLEERSEQASSHFGVEDGDTDALGGQAIGVRARGSLDEAVKAETAQVVTICEEL